MLKCDQMSAYRNVLADHRNNSFHCPAVKHLFNVTEHFYSALPVIYLMALSALAYMKLNVMTKTNNVKSVSTTITWGNVNELPALAHAHTWNQQTVSRREVKDCTDVRMLRR